MRPSTALLRSLALALLAGGLLFASASRASAQTPSAPSSPPVSPTITRADDGKTIQMQVGDRYLLKLGEEFDWTVTVADQSVVSRVPNIAVVRGAQGIYEAKKQGATDLDAVGTLHCDPGVPCAALAALFHVHLVVGGEASPTTTPSQSPTAVPTSSPTSNPPTPTATAVAPSVAPGAPNVGSGSGSDAGSTWGRWFLLAGLGALIGGAGALAIGKRRRD